jgi:glucosamine-6-phosphate deaminase
MKFHDVPNSRIPTRVFADSAQASRYVALELDALIRKNNAANRPTILGLATGSTPVGLYRELIRLHKDERLDLSLVETFNLDEYYPMPNDDSHSYNQWMWETFFRHVNIARKNIHIPDGTTPPDKVQKYCEDYEQLIRDRGGIDVQILGIGRTGHIGFNEPGSTRESRTRLVTLDPVTRRDAASSFFGEENVPQQAITMGVGTILEARRVIIMAFGELKAKIVKKAVEGEITDAVTASFLQKHKNRTFILDQAAAGELTALRRPWELGPIKWTPERIRQAVIWLSLEVKKALLKLDDNDFRSHHLFELLREHGPAPRLGQQVFEDRLRTLHTHPAGTEPKTILVFSPHPDDDVISMGGTLIRLVEQGHKVHIAYMTSGNIAVFDHDAWRFIDFVREFNKSFKIDTERTDEVFGRVQAFLAERVPGQQDSPDLLGIKQLIRETEARAAAAAINIPRKQLEFMDLRFYRTGTITKAPIHPLDIADIVALLERLEPAQIYVAGEMSDPHGTHRVCAEAIFDAVRQVRQKHQQFDVWLYRGAWEEWEPHDIDMAVPLSPTDVERKRMAIFRHQSQKDRAMFPGGTDHREFWQRAEDRNRDTARTYDGLGLPEFFALEAFVKWRDESAT